MLSFSVWKVFKFWKIYSHRHFQMYEAILRVYGTLEIFFAAKLRAFWEKLYHCEVSHFSSDTIKYRFIILLWKTRRGVVIIDRQTTLKSVCKPYFPSNRYQKFIEAETRISDFNIGRRRMISVLLNFTDFIVQHKHLCHILKDLKDLYGGYLTKERERNIPRAKDH